MSDVRSVIGRGSFHPCVEAQFRVASRATFLSCSRQQSEPHEAVLIRRVTKLHLVSLRLLPPAVAVGVARVLTVISPAGCMPSNTCGTLCYRRFDTFPCPS